MDEKQVKKIEREHKIKINMINVRTIAKVSLITTVLAVGITYGVIWDLSKKLTGSGRLPFHIDTIPVYEFKNETVTSNGSVIEYIKSSEDKSRNGFLIKRYVPSENKIYEYFTKNLSDEKIDYLVENPESVVLLNVTPKVNEYYGEFDDYEPYVIVEKQSIRGEIIGQRKQTDKEEYEQDTAHAIPLMLSCGVISFPFSLLAISKRRKLIQKENNRYELKLKSLKR